MRTRFVRLLSAAVAVVSGALATLMMASPAQASGAPDTWPKGEALSTLEVIGIFVGGPLLLCVVIGLFAAATARNNYTPPAPSTDVEVRGDTTPATH